MIDRLHRDYLQDMQAYAACKKYWENLFELIIKECDADREWKVLERTYTVEKDGTVWDPVYEAKEFNCVSPILRCICATLNRGIFLTLATKQKNDIHPEYHQFIMDRSAWETGFTEGEIELFKIYVLLTEENFETVKNAMCLWVDPETSFDEMKNRIKENKFEIKGHP